MNCDPDTPRPTRRHSKLIVFLQYLLPVSFTCAMLGIILWIVSLIMLSRELNDTPSASMGISIVAIPIFLVMLTVFWYVFLGVIRNQEEESPDADNQQNVENREEVES